jgi:hypothetical protein
LSTHVTDAYKRMNMQTEFIPCLLVVTPCNLDSKMLKLSLCHEGIWGNGCRDPHFLDLVTSGRLVVSFTPRPLYPQGRARVTHWIGGWVDPRAGLDDMEKIKFLNLPELEIRPLSRPARS